MNLCARACHWKSSPWHCRKLCARAWPCRWASGLAPAPAFGWRRRLQTSAFSGQGRPDLPQLSEWLPFGKLSPHHTQICA
eukprot:4103653-Prymnesium_polylepis.1